MRSPSAPGPDELLARLDGLYHLVTVYGVILTALELHRPLSAATALLEEEDLGGARPADLVRQLVSRGGAALAQALVEVAEAAAPRRDRPTRDALVRLQAHASRVARINAAAVLASLRETEVEAPPLSTAVERESLRRDVQVFLEAVERLAAATRSEAPASLPGSPSPVGGPQRPWPPVAGVPQPSPPAGDLAASGDRASAAPPVSAPQPRPTPPTPEAVDRLRDLVEVFQDVLQGLAGDHQPPDAGSSPVRSGRLPADRYTALAEELAQRGGGLILDELLALEDAGAPPEVLDPIRRRLIDGVVTTVPRVLSRLSGMPAAGADREERARLLHDLTTFVARFADLCAEGSLLRQRFREMTLALRARLDRTILRQGL